MVQIIVDSTADMSLEIARQFRISIIPQFVHIGERVFLDGVDLLPSQLFELVAQTGQLPKTAAAPVETFHKFFDVDEPVVFISLSSSLSGLIQSARLAAQELPEGQVRIVDSLNVSSGIALLALLAADLRDQGLLQEEIATRLEEMRSKVSTSFIVETMEYVRKSGRVSVLQAVAGSLLKIRPILEARADGTMGLKSKTHGSRRKGLQTLLDDFTADIPELDRKRVFVTHTGCDNDAEFLRAEVSRLANPEKVYVTLTGSVISSHCGPGTIGIMYMKK
jgi:DegV family protein with EDD domain